MDLTQKQIHDLLDYDPLTGVFVWKVRNSDWFKSESSMKSWNTRYSNKRAGRQKADKDGYEKREISINNKLYLEHRLAWLYMTGEKPPSEIDHLDRDSTNNTWSNLRDGTCGVNHKNRSKRKNNTSGETNVYWDKQTMKWCASIRMNKKNHWLGRHTSLDEARDKVMNFYTENGYSEGHGQST